MNKCKNPICIEDAEAERYEFCKHCWWEQDPRNDCPKKPYATSENSHKNLTIGDLKEMLKNLPNDYLVSFDNASGYCRIGNFTIYENKKAISING
jgi:hypothetical protein